MSQSPKEALDDIYQESITELEPYWNSAREKNNETIIVDEIISHYSDRLSKIDLSEEKIVDFLTEWAFNGIT